MSHGTFDLVLPSMPGYRFSGKPTGTGWEPDHIARAWAERGRQGRPLRRWEQPELFAELRATFTSFAVADNQ